MPVMRIFDFFFIDQLFHQTERGETIFYPNGRLARGFQLPPEREAAVRSGVRWLVLASLSGTFGLIWLAGAIESWSGFTIPVMWYVSGAAVALAVIVYLVIRALARLTAGLTPLPSA